MSISIAPKIYLHRYATEFEYPLQQNRAANGRRHAHRERPTGRQGQAAALPGLAHGVGFANVREAMGMAAAEDTPALTLEIGSGRVPYRDFQKIVGAFTGLLNAISEEACGDPQAVHWEISVSEGSVLIVARLPAATDAQVVSRIQETVRKPPIRIRRSLHQFLGADRQDILAENQQDTAPHPSQTAEYGTVEGTLDTLSARGCKSGMALTWRW